MRSSLSTRTALQSQVIKLSLIAVAVFLVGGCSRAEVQVNNPPFSDPFETAASSQGMSRQAAAAKRIVEIDRLLAAPVTGRVEDSDQRALLRAERAALVDSGQVPNRLHNKAMANHNGYGTDYSTTVTRRHANGDVVNYSAAPPSQNGGVVVAPNSQARDLPFLEQMTPTERERYFRELRLQNRGRVQVDVQHHY
jgi:hypothetical protein